MLIKTRLIVRSKSKSFDWGVNIEIYFTCLFFLSKVGIELLTTT